MENKGEVCLEEEVEKMRRSGMSTDEISQQMGVDRTWVESLVSMVEGNDYSASQGEAERGRDPATIVEEAKTVAVVGLSNNPEKASNEVGSYLMEQGYRVIPVNPNEEEVLGERAYGAVEQIPEQVDVVDVFLPAEKTPEVARDAVRAGAKALWLQEGIESAEARRIAEEGGLDFVENRCMRKTHEGSY